MEEVQTSLVEIDAKAGQLDLWLADSIRILKPKGGTPKPSRAKVFSSLYVLSFSFSCFVCFVFFSPLIINIYFLYCLLFYQNNFFLIGGILDNSIV